MAVYTYSAEVYPTRVRGVAQSIGGFAARIGGAVTPFIAQVGQLWWIQEGEGGGSLGVQTYIVDFACGAALHT